MRAKLGFGLLQINLKSKKIMMTSEFIDTTQSSNFVYVAIFLLASLVTGASFMLIS